MTTVTAVRAPSQGFPSGQRGRAQDPLLSASQVRILFPAPLNSIDYYGYSMPWFVNSHVQTNQHPRLV